MVKCVAQLLVVLILTAWFLGFDVQASFAATNSITPGQLVVEPPTLHSLGFEWPVTGDDNRNAEVKVEYRLVGSQDWKTGLSLFRMNGEVVASSQPALTYIVPNTFAGSIFDLKPGSTYEVRLTLTDPDGGNQTQQLTTKTKAEAQLHTGGNTLHLYPTNFSGTKQTPSYTTFSTAYAAVQPGDTILVHAGTYPSNGTASNTLNKIASFDKPIVIRGEDQATTIFDGVTNGWFSLFTLSGATHHIFENLTFKNATFGFTGSSAENITIRNNRFQTTLGGNGDTIYCRTPTCKNFTIINNYFEGPLTSWTPRTGYKEATGILIGGTGHDIAFNTIVNYWDGIVIRSLHPGTVDATQWTKGIDIYQNQISNIMDDCMELDNSTHNVRAYRNFCYNIFMAFSTQPVYGGPVYIFRNITYNHTQNPLKFNVQPAGILVFNNTFVGRRGFTTLADWSNSQLFNNLFMGVDGGVDNYTIQAGTATPLTTKLDYNGYRYNQTENQSRVISWGKQYPSIAAFSQGTGYEVHGKQLDYDIFNAVTQASGIHSPLPNLDFHLKPGSAAMDAGTVIANITDGYSGTAPDMGALEGTQPFPAVGVQTGMSPSPTPTQCTGDINQDKTVNLSDYSLLVSNFLKLPLTNPRADLNGNGKVDLVDYSLLVSNFLKSCP